MGIPSAIADSTGQPDKPDRFEPLETHWHFPCGMCVHRDDSEPETCKGCRFYFN